MSKFVVIISLIFLLLLFQSKITANIKAFLLITQEFPQIPIKPLNWVSSSLKQQKIEFETKNGKVVADIVLPQKKSAPALILAMGVKTQEKDKQIILHFADTMARLGYVVMWPRLEKLDQGIPDFENRETFIKAFEYLENTRAVDSKRISYVGFSVGSSVALAAAQDQSVSEKVRSVVFFGGYYDVRAYLDALAGGGTWQPAEGATNHVKEILQTRGLSSLDELSKGDLDSIDPSRHIDRLKAKVFILHDRHDNYVPYQESEKLYKALPKTQVGRSTIVNLFEHVQPKEGFSLELVGEFLKLYHFVSSAIEYL